MTTLETGAGLSTIVFAASGGKHTAISPVEAEHRGIEEWCRAHEIDTSRLRFFVGSSHVVLDRRWQGEPIDVALLDGAHAFPIPVLDWFFVAVHVRTGGYMLLDDAYQPAVGMLVRYLRASPAWEMTSVLGHQTPCFRKLDDNYITTAWDENVVGKASFGYLPPARRAKEATRHWILKRSPFRPLVRRLIPLLRRS